MKNLYLLPTDKPSRLHLAYNKDYYLSVEPFIQLDTKNYKSFNIYITSDEDFDNGNYVILNELYSIRQIEKYCWNGGNDDKVYKLIGGGLVNKTSAKKIILTTDQDLIKDNIQELSERWIEYIVNNPKCEYLEVTERKVKKYDGTTLYKIIIPKEELKLFKQMEKLTKVDWEKFKKSPFPSKEEPKQQETVEDAAIKWFMSANKREIIFDLGWIKIFEAGAKWQQEKSYSEEEVYTIIKMCVSMKGSGKTDIEIVEYFEQFKKK